MTAAPIGTTLIANAIAIPTTAVSGLALDEWRREIVALCWTGGRLVSLFVTGARPGSSTAEVWAVVARDDRGDLGLCRTTLAGPGYPALTSEIPSAQAFEREIFEQHGIRPDGHPWLKPLRRHPDLEPAAGAPHPFFAVDGPGIHEVAVGPVHAGIIEPGHFRFQCHGETVLHLEIQLGYQHRGVEGLIRTGSPARRLVAVESIAGDTSVGHAIAYATAVEALAGVEPPLRAQAVRGIALEIERLANHVGDLGALCNDVGYLPGASWFGRLRGELLNLLMELSGNRYGRGLVRPGGTRFDVDDRRREDWIARLVATERDVASVAELTFATPTVASRFEQAGVVTREIADGLGLVGPAARASGCDRDVRRDHPAGIYRFAHVPVALSESGDVMGRALVRLVEARRSFTFVREQLEELPRGDVSIAVPPARADHVVVSCVEGWRGEIVHAVTTDAAGSIASYKVVDPSFHNWFGLAMAMRGQPISDFPLCNKSFNLSYAGHDL